MNKEYKVLFYLFAVIFVSFFCISSGQAQGVNVTACAEGEQPTGSVYRIYMPPEIQYTGRFIIWAHGFQDAGTPVEIPEGQLCVDNVCFPDIAVQMGIGFATNSYRKTGLAVKQGMADIIDLVVNLITYGESCVPENPHIGYIIGPSEGGLITALLAERYPQLFDGGYALCGPIGDFRYEINYLGNARVTFEYFFPNQIPGHGVFNDDETIPTDWDLYFEMTIVPLLLNHPLKFSQWVNVAKLPYDSNNPMASKLNSSKDVLRYSVMNMPDAIEVLKGQPFDNRWKWYSGSLNDVQLNKNVQRIRAVRSAVRQMKKFYNTSGDLAIPLITIHTLLDPQVPYFHEIFYNFKTIASGSFLTDHFNIPIDRYGHCNFTLDEALGGFALMLLYAGDLEMLSNLEALLQTR